MKVAKVYALDDIRIEDMPTPEVGPGEALIRMKVCGLCTSDMIPWYVARKVPAVLGHEPVGVVVKVGRDTVGFQKGDSVFVHHHAPCFTCRLCRRGFFSLCKAWRASHLVPGGLAEFVKIPAHNLKYDTLKLPEGMSFEDGSLIEPLACSVKALKRARVQSGDIALVIGLGIMGQLNALLARRYGARMVIGADLVPYRLEKVLSLGAGPGPDGRADGRRGDRGAGESGGHAVGAVLRGQGGDGDVLHALRAGGAAGDQPARPLLQ
jgi:L-iditol 2-dehydrogenase